MSTMSRNARVLEPLSTATWVALLAIPHPQESISAYLLTALLLRGEDLAAQIKHWQRAWDLYGFADFEDRKVPVQNM